MPIQPDPEALVLRFPPGGPDEIDKIRKEAKYVHRHHQRVGDESWYRLSVWADVAEEGEAESDLMRRLIHAAGLARIDLSAERNRIFWWTHAQRLYERGFVFRKDGYVAEPAEHYSVDLGEHEPTRDVIGRFVDAFTAAEETGRIR